MMRRKISRKELVKGPDEFITLTGKAILWSRSHVKELLIGAGVILAVLVLASGYQLYSARRQQSADMLLSQNLSAYQEAQSRQDEPGKVLASVKPDFEKLIAEYGREPAGRAGRIILAHAALSGHASDEALALYRKALSDYGQDPSMTNILHNGLACAYLQKGDNAGAIDQFTRIAESSSMVLKDAALFHLGYLYAATGEAEKSRKAFQQLKSDFPDSLYAEVAKEKAAG